jgi:hypothetical protein
MYKVKNRNSEIILEYNSLILLIMQGEAKPIVKEFCTHLIYRHKMYIML